MKNNSTNFFDKKNIFTKLVYYTSIPYLPRIPFLTGIIFKKHMLRQTIIEAKKHFGDKEIVACEIGVFRGEHARNLVSELNIKKLYLIDPYEKYADYKGDSSYKYLVSAKTQAKKNLRGFENKLVWIENYSDEAISKIKDKIDLLYIDGNHYSPFVDNDIKNYYPLVKKGGLVAGHDYHPYWGDVVRAVDSFSKKVGKKVVVGLGTDWIIFK